MTYYFVSNNERKGPYELEELKAMGVITPDTLVWTNGMPDWVKASEVADMQVILNPTMAANDYSAYQPQQEPVQPEVTVAQPQPQYQEPVQPQYQEPVQPQYQEPVQPQYQQPAQPQYQEPVQPQYQQPAQPQYQQPAQQPYQQPAQPYQQPYPQPYQQPYEAPKKKKSKAWLWILLGLLVAALAVMAITNPSAKDHMKEIQKEMTNALSQASGSMGNELGAVMGMMGDKLAPMLEKQLDYHNYVFFSTVTDKNGERLSWGLFGNVWANIDENEVKKLQESMDSLKNIGGSFGDALDESTNDNSSDNATTSDETSTVATTPNDDDIPDLNLDDLGRELDKAGDELNDALNDLQRELDNL